MCPVVIGGVETANGANAWTGVPFVGRGSGKFGRAKGFVCTSGVLVYLNKASSPGKTEDGAAGNVTGLCCGGGGGGKVPAA